MNIPGNFFCLKWNKPLLLTLLIAFLISATLPLQGQDLYSARGYWTEFNKDTYKKIKEKKQKGGSLTLNESAYFNDYEVYLDNYYKRMSKDEKVIYEQMKGSWIRKRLLPLRNILGPGVTLLGLLAAESDNSNLIGASLLAGGIGGLIIGNNVAKKYDYSPGDVNVIGSLTLITTGLGFTIAAETIDTGEISTLLLNPKATAMAGTIIGQQMVKGASLTKKGSTINLTSRFHQQKIIGPHLCCWQLPTACRADC